MVAQELPEREHPSNRRMPASNFGTKGLFPQRTVPLICLPGSRSGAKTCSQTRDSVTSRLGECQAGGDPGLGVALGHPGKVEYAASFEQAVERGCGAAHPGDAVMTLGAGNVAQAEVMVVEQLAAG